MDGAWLSQRATSWWVNAVAGDMANQVSTLLADVVSELVTAIDDHALILEEPTDHGPGHRVRSLTGFKVTAEILHRAPMTLPKIVQDLSALAKSNRDALAGIAANLRVGANADRFQEVFENVAVAIGIATAEADPHIIELNSAFAELFGQAANALRGGVRVADLVVAGKPASEAIADHPLRFDLLEGVASKFDAGYRRDDGSEGYVLLATRLVPATPNAEAYVLVAAHDVTDTRQKMAELSWQARHDPLTGLPNRRYLAETLQEIAAGPGSADQLGLCLVDVDSFKIVNDSLGHVAGDRVLVEVARRLNEAVHEFDGQIFRIGGDEFTAVVRPPVDAGLMAEVSVRLREALAEPVVIDDHSLSIGITTGTTLVNAQDAVDDVGRVFTEVDAELYKAKRAR